MTRPLIVLVIAVTLAVSGALGFARDPAPPPATAPAASDPGGFAQLSSGDLTAVVSGLQARLREVPEDHTGWATLGLAYVELARVTGNPSYYPRAERAIDRSRELAPDDNAVGLAAGSALAAARHDFSEALSLAERALRVDPFQPGALAVRVDALVELGRYDEQLTALRQADRRQPGVPVAARFAYFYELRGDLGRAAEILRRAAASANRADSAYLLTLLADIERRHGRPGAAGRHLRQALRAQPGNVPALVSRARLTVARRDLPLAVERWQRVVTRLPLPEYLVELGELHAHVGDRRASRRQYDVVDATTTLLDENGVNTDLEVALYEADHGDPLTAVRSAREEYRRRQSIHAADALAWALHRTGQDVRALELAREATRLGTAEARLWLHRGSIEAALGRDDAARRHLRRGLRIDPGVSPWQADRAEALLEDLGVSR